MISLVAGYLIGTHIGSKGLNDHHPFLEINNSALIYQNSFNRTSLAVFKTLNYDNFKLRIGLTTGYNKINYYNGEKHKADFALQDGTALFMVPSYERDNFIVAICGNSVNIGFKF